MRLRSLTLCFCGLATAISFAACSTVSAQESLAATTSVSEIEEFSEMLASPWRPTTRSIQKACCKATGGTWEVDPDGLMTGCSWGPGAPATTPGGETYEQCVQRALRFWLLGPSLNLE